MARRTNGLGYSLSIGGRAQLDKHTAVLRHDTVFEEMGQNSTHPYTPYFVVDRNGLCR